MEERHKRAALWAQPSTSETDGMKILTPNSATSSSVANSQCQPPSTVNPSTFVPVGSQSPLTAITDPQVQTTPTSAFNSLLPTSTPVVQPPRPASPMTHFLNSTSSLDSYSWGGDNRSTSLNSSGPFDFSQMDFSGLSSSGLEPLLGAHQLHTFDTGLGMSGASLLAPALPTAVPLTSTTSNGFIPPNIGSPYMPLTSTPFPSALPTSAVSLASTTANDFIPPNSAHMPPTSTPLHPALPTSAPLMSTTAYDCIPPNSAHTPPTSTPLYAALPTSALPLTSTTANNSIPPSSAHMPPASTPLHPALPTSLPLASTTASDSKKRKSYEEQNAHCVLPEGSRRARKSRHIEGADDENTPRPKKRNTNTDKKGKGNKRRK